MIAVAMLCIPFAITGAGITRWEGIAFLGLYAAYLTYLVLDATESGAARTFGIAALVVAVPTIAVAAVIELRRDRTRER